MISILSVGKGMENKIDQFINKVNPLDVFCVQCFVIPLFCENPYFLFDALHHLKNSTSSRCNITMVLHQCVHVI